MDDKPLELIACYEGESYEGELSPYHRLSGSMSDDNLWAYLIEQCRCGCERYSPSSVAEAAAYLLSQKILVIGGGVVVNKGEFHLFPGCCSGVEEWKNWRRICKGGYSPWMGHDPGPWVDTKGDKAVFHNDCDTVIKTAYADYGDIQRALDRVEADLKDFLKRLEAYLKEKGAENVPQVVTKIGQNYNILS